MTKSMQKEVPVTLDLILKKNRVENSSTLEIELMKLKRIWLDRSGINLIDNLELLGNVTHIYLNNNSISVIQNLESLSSTLQHLSLKSNRIEAIGEGLICLDRLVSLDISSNQISEISADELPERLSMLDIRDNPVLISDAFSEDIFLEELENLTVYNGETLVDENEEERGDKKEGGDESLQSATRRLKEDSQARQALIEEGHAENVRVLQQLKTEMEVCSQDMRASAQKCSLPQPTIRPGSRELTPLTPTILTSPLPTPTDNRPLSSKSLAQRKGSQILEPIKPRSSPKTHGRRVTEEVDISLRPSLDQALVDMSELDTYLEEVKGRFENLRSSCAEL